MSIDINKCAFTSQDNCCQWHIAQDFPEERAEQDQRWMPCKCSEVILISFIARKSFGELFGVLISKGVCLHRFKRTKFERALLSFRLISFVAGLEI